MDQSDIRTPKCTQRGGPPVLEIFLKSTQFLTPSTNSLREMESTGLQDHLRQKNIAKILTFDIERCSFYEVSKTLTK